MVATVRCLFVSRDPMPSKAGAGGVQTAPSKLSLRAIRLCLYFGARTSGHSQRRPPFHVPPAQRCSTVRSGTKQLVVRTLIRVVCSTKAHPKGQRAAGGPRELRAGAARAFNRNSNCAQQVAEEVAEEVIIPVSELAPPAVARLEGQCCSARRGLYSQRARVASS